MVPDKACTDEVTTIVLGGGVSAPVDRINKGSNAMGGSSGGGATHAFIRACSLSIVLMRGVESLLTAFFSALPQPFLFPKNFLQTVSRA